VGNVHHGALTGVSDAESSFELLTRARAGDAEALDRLLFRHLGPLKRWASGRLPRWARDLSDTQDLVQDTVLRALKHVKTFHPQHDGALQAYLRQAVANRIRDELRRAHRQPGKEELQDNVPANVASPLALAIGEEMVQRYETALAELRPEDREAIVARVELGQSYEAVAAALGKPSVDAARVAVQRALVKLAKRMRDGG
jgi:RNA polymerase sigma factor (sigma-70 family)